MKVFRYLAKDGSGQRMEGLLEGESSAGVSRNLVAKGLFPVQLSEVVSDGGLPGKAGFLKNLWVKIGTRPPNSQSLALFTRRLGDLLDAGLPMQKAVQQLYLQTKEKRLRHVLRSVSFRVKSGESLSQALAGDGSVFPKSLIGAVEAGETGGGLTQILAGLAELYEKEDDLERTVKSALLYPALVLIVSAATLVVMFSYLLPKLSVLYSDLGQDLPGPTKFLIDFSAFTQTYGAGILALTSVLLLVLLFLHSKYPQFQFLVSRVLLKLPFVGRINLNREIVRFAHTLASLVGGGVPLMRGLWFASKSSGNMAFAAELEGFGSQVGGGASLSSVIGDSLIGESVLVMMVQIGEEQGDLAKSLEKAGRVYERELRDRMKVITTVLEPMLIVFLGLVVGFIVFSMMLPIMELNLA
ncbi:MAG: type II secretion system F family protein [Gemmatimonadales bacterium]|nr:type II secretion system F family protein [Gemmatimonadales bacterium]